MDDTRRSPTKEPIEIDTRYDAERWNYVCPRGHVDWRTTPEGFHCHTCEDVYGDAQFAALLARRTGERIPRNCVRVTRTAVAAAYEVERRDPSHRARDPG